MTKISIKIENLFSFGEKYQVADKSDQTIGRTKVETLGERRTISEEY